MKIISEYKLTQEQIKNYREKGYEVYYGYEHPSIKPGESVGILLSTMYKSTMDMIDDLLHRKTKSKITIKYEDTVYHISIPEDWKYKWYEQKEHKWCSFTHPLLIEYNNKRASYFEDKAQKKSKEHMSSILEYFDNRVPEDLDVVLNNFARLYELDIDYDSLESKLRAYQSIQYYLDNDIEYSKDILGISPDEESMFDCISFGDETYLEDVLYKHQTI